MPTDDFELLLERCRSRLSEISLSVPTLESGAARKAPSYSLGPPPAAPKAAAPPPAPPPPPTPAVLAPAEAQASPPQPAAGPPAAGAAEEPEEDEMFPPLSAREKTPPPSQPLWGARPTPTPAPLPERAGTSAGGRRAAAAAAAAVVAAGALGVWWARRPAADLDIDVGEGDAMAVRADKGDLLVAEGKELVDLSRDGRTLGRRPLDSTVDSMCWARDSLWTVDGRTQAVVERSDDGRSTVFSLNHVPGAVYINGKNLWTAEKNGGVLHQFLISRSILGAMLQPLDSFELTGLSPEAFTIDDAGTLWLADAESRRLYRLRLENGSYRRVASAPLSPFVGPEGKLRDLTIEGNALWILAQKAGGRVSLRRIALSRLDWKPA